MHVSRRNTAATASLCPAAVTLVTYACSIIVNLAVCWMETPCTRTLLLLCVNLCAIALKLNLCFVIRLRLLCYNFQFGSIHVHARACCLSHNKVAYLSILVRSFRNLSVDIFCEHNANNGTRNLKI